MDQVIDPTVTIKAIGHQWYWSYKNSDQNKYDKEELFFDTQTIPKEQI